MRKLILLVTLAAVCGACMTSRTTVKTDGTVISKERIFGRAKLAEGAKDIIVERNEDDVPEVWIGKTGKGAETDFDFEDIASGLGLLWQILLKVAAASGGAPPSA